MRKKFIFYFLIILFLLSAKVKAISVTADAAILMDATTGKILFKKNIHKKRPPASTTKILTAYLALQKGQLDSLVTVSKRAALETGSSLYLKEGEKLSLLDLLYGLMLSSGNDGATAIAEHIAGSVEEFAVLMNELALEAGALNSNFKNPHGLPDNEHLTTAYDMAMITRLALKDPKFQEIVSTKNYTMAQSGLAWQRGLHNFNRLLWSFDGADGVKTGYTCAAGRCLVATASRNGRQVIAVLLHCGDRWGDASRLLEYGLEKFYMYTLVEKGESLGKVKVLNQQPVSVSSDKELNILLPKQESLVLIRKITMPEELKGNLAKGTPIGKMEITCGNETKSVQLLLDEEIKEETFWQKIKRLAISS